MDDDDDDDRNHFRFSSLLHVPTIRAEERERDGDNSLSSVDWNWELSSLKSVCFSVLIYAFIHSFIVIMKE